MFITAVILIERIMIFGEIAVRTALKAKKKLGFVDGSLKWPEPKNDEDITQLQT